LSPDTVKTGIDSRQQEYMRTVCSKTLVVGRREGHLVCTKLGVGLSLVTTWL